MSVFKELFSNLSLRFYKENDLSDITWAICKSSNNFQQLFLNFFFPNEAFNQINSFNREFSKDDSRADFVIDNGGEVFVVECKINDRNHHFEQYINAYKITNNQLGYIVNYTMIKEGYDVKTWENFYDYIESDLYKYGYDERKLFEGYLDYVKNVCGIIKIKGKMELKDINSLYKFNVILKSVIHRDMGSYILSYFNTDFKESYYGYKFKVESQNKEDIWLSAGLWFCFDNPVITVGVWKRDGWGKPFCDEIESGKKHEVRYANKQYWEDSTYFFEGSDVFYDEFKNASNINEQKQVLCNFVDEVVNFYVSS